MLTASRVIAEGRCVAMRHQVIPEVFAYDHHWRSFETSFCAASWSVSASRGTLCAGGLDRRIDPPRSPCAHRLTRIRQDERRARI